jgi:hypothetical protein
MWVSENVFIPVDKLEKGFQQFNLDKYHPFPALNSSGYLYLVQILKLHLCSGLFSSSFFYCVWICMLK